MGLLLLLDNICFSHNEIKKNKKMKITIQYLAGVWITELIFQITVRDVNRYNQYASPPSGRRRRSLFSVMRPPYTFPSLDYSISNPSMKTVKRTLHSRSGIISYILNSNSLNTSPISFPNHTDTNVRRPKRQTNEVIMFLVPMHGGIWTLCVDLPGV